MVIWISSSRINQGAQALLSYNYGSGNYKRVIETALLELFPEVFIRIFTSAPSVIKEAAWMVRLYSAVFL